MSWLRPTGRLCPQCRHVIDLRARVCPNCHTPLGWRGLISVRQTSLALLVALVSVTTPLLNVLLPRLKPNGSAIQLLFESMSENDVTFVVRNEGRNGGVIRIDGLSITAQTDDDSYNRATFIDLLPNSNFIEPGRGGAHLWAGEGQYPDKVSVQRLVRAVSSCTRRVVSTLSRSSLGKRLT